MKTGCAGESPQAVAFLGARFLTLTRLGRPGLFQSMSARRVLQDPYGMGYKGCATAVTLLDGGTVPKYVDTGVIAVTQANMNDKNILDLLDPTRLKR